MLAKSGIVAFGIALTATAQVAHAQGQAEIGRFQIVIPINSDATAILLDTVTGRSWILSGNKARGWADLNYGKVKDGHLVLMPAPCTQDNPTCYFEMPKSKQAESEAVH
jgi:hypothetical protein